MWTYETYNELYHHGIKGQTWGVRRGPPYPLEGGRSKKSSKSEGSSKKKGLTDKQKKILGTVAVVAAIGAIGYLGVRSGALDSVVNIGANALGDTVPKIDPATGLKLKETAGEAITKETLLEDAKLTNPTGNLENCQKCAVNVILRSEKGLDTEALSGVGDLNTTAALQKVFTGAKWDYIDAGSVKGEYDGFCKKAIASGEGSYGLIQGHYRGDTQGHCIAYKVINNELVFTDGQSGEVLKEPYNDLFSKFGPMTLEFANLTNADINPEGLSELVQERTRK